MWDICKLGKQKREDIYGRKNKLQHFGPKVF